MSRGDAFRSVLSLEDDNDDRVLYNQCLVTCGSSANIDRKDYNV
jgi:hypothetical protein